MEKNEKRQTGADPPMTNPIPNHLRRLAREAIPDPRSCLDYLECLRAYIVKLQAENAEEELRVFLAETTEQLAQDAARAKVERRQAKVYRIYGYLMPAAIPLMIGILNGTITVG